MAPSLRCGWNSTSGYRRGLRRGDWVACKKRGGSSVVRGDRLSKSGELDRHREDRRSRRRTDHHSSALLRRIGMAAMIVLRVALHRHGAIGLRLHHRAKTNARPSERGELGQQQCSEKQATHDGTSISSRLRKVNRRRIGTRWGIPSAVGSTVDLRRCDENAGATPYSCRSVVGQGCNSA